MRTIRTAGHRTLPALDEDRYPPRPGLEGPIRQLSGHVLYYDSREGKYYDPSRDMYVSDEELAIMQNPRPGVTAAKAKKKEEASFVKEGDEDETESFTRLFDLNRENKK